MQENTSSDEEKKKQIITIHRNELTSIGKKLDKLIEMNIAENISVEEFNRKRSEYKIREQELKMIIDDLRSTSEEKILTSVKDLLTFGAVAVEAFQNSTDQEKRTILSALGSNLSIKDKKLQIEFEKPLSLLEDVSCSIRGKRVKKDRLEPVQVHKKKRTYSNKKAISPVMLREQDSNLHPDASG